MGFDTTDLRNKARRLKNLAITRAIEVLENPEKYKAEYNETYQTVLKNSVPRSQEITGEDGQGISIVIAKSIADKNNINDLNSSTGTDSEVNPQV